MATIEELKQQIIDLKHERDLAVSALSQERDEAVLAYEQMSDAFGEIVRNADRMKAVSRYAAFAMSGMLVCVGGSGCHRLDRRSAAEIAFDFGEAMYDEQVARTGFQTTNCRCKVTDLAHNHNTSEQGEST